MPVWGTAPNAVAPGDQEAVPGYTPPGGTPPTRWPLTGRQRAGTPRVTGVRAEVLSLLDADQPRTVHDLAQQTGKTPGTLRPVLRKLVADGHAVATAPPTSRRRAYLRAGGMT